MKTEELHEKIDRLLHDADHTESGAMMARVMRDRGAELSCIEKAAALLGEANRLDPQHTAPAWEEKGC